MARSEQTLAAVSNPDQDVLTNMDAYISIGITGSG